MGRGLEISADLLVGATHECPQQRHPQIDQQKGNPNKEQSHHRILHGRSDPARVFQPVGGFNPNTSTIILIQGTQAQRHARGRIRIILPPMFPICAVAVDTHHRDVTGRRPIGLTRHRIPSFVTLPALKQPPGSALLAPDDHRHLTRNVSGLKPPNGRDAEKASIQIQPLDPNTKRVGSVEHPSDNAHHRVVPADRDEGDGDPFALADHRACGVRIKGTGAGSASLR